MSVSTLASRDCGLGAPPVVGQVLRFAATGVGSTVGYAVLYVLMREVLGPQAANAVSLLTTAVAGTEVNRRWTFGWEGRVAAGRVLLAHSQSLLVFGVGLVATAGSLAALHAVADPGRGAELVVTLTASLAASVLRFVLLRWVLRPQGLRHPGTSPGRRPSDGCVVAGLSQVA